MTQKAALFKSAIGSKTMTAPTPDDAEARLAGFIARFSPDVAARARDSVAALRARLPGANLLVYDNYNALAVGFGATERSSDIVFSVAVFPRWVSLFLVGGPALHDPKGLLRGAGTTMRHIVLAEAGTLDDPDVRALMDQALASAKAPIDSALAGKLIIKSVSAKQRPRRA